jgi:hypothetical protein
MPQQRTKTTMNIKFVARCSLLSLVLVDATNRYLRGADSNYTSRTLLAQQVRGGEAIDPDDYLDNRLLRLSTNQLVLGGGVIAPENCPTPDLDASCPTDTEATVAEEEISCRGCIYANACIASAAGFLIRRDCQNAAFANSEATGNNLNCPAVQPTDLCLDLIDPVACDNCEYGNNCLADQAGFNSVTDCERVATPPPVEEGFVNPALLLCRNPDPSFLCFDNAKFICGENECLYNSTCQANAAGIVLSTCRVADQSTCRDVSFAGIFCVPGTPVICGLGCIYDSQCKANSAGYSAATCGPVPEPEPEVADTTNTNVNTGELGSSATNNQANCGLSTCPPVFNAVKFACASAPVDPILCRDGCCEYDNRCLAAGAGFNTQLSCLLRNPPVEDTDTSTASNNAGNGSTEALPDLAPEDCPNVRDDIPCTGRENLVLCRGCEYFNRCFASGAGFNEGSCVRKDVAPAFPAATEPALAAPAPPPTSLPTDQPSEPAATVDEPVAAVDEPAEPVPVQSTTADEPAAPAPLPTSPPADQPTDAPAPVCPPVSTSKICPSSFNPVNCDTCRYENICKAEAAGFTQSQCTNSFAAPAPAPALTFGSGLGGYGGGSAGISTDSTTSFLSQVKSVPAPAPSTSTNFGGFGTFP